MPHVSHGACQSCFMSAMLHVTHARGVERQLLDGSTGVHEQGAKALTAMTVASGCRKRLQPQRERRQRRQCQTVKNPCYAVLCYAMLRRIRVISRLGPAWRIHVQVDGSKATRGIHPSATNTPLGSHTCRDVPTGLHCLVDGWGGRGTELAGPHAEGGSSVGSSSGQPDGPGPPGVGVTAGVTLGTEPSGVGVTVGVTLG
jgi:hypothetical protein